MPELPEVETVKNELAPHVIGRRISGITLFWERMVSQPSVEEFCSRIIGRKITGMARRGKYLFFNLDNPELLVMHLKMSGSLLLKPNSDEPDRFARAIIHLDNNTQIQFRDPRKFGAIWLTTDKNTVTDKLGPEPLETGFTLEVLAKRLCNRKAPIKALLFDQNFIAGIGNMYADEALAAAGIHPLRPGRSLSRDEIKRLHRAIQQVLKNGITHLGASTDTYYRPSGEKGFAHHHFKVAHQGGKPCPKCGTLIKRTVVHNRGTYFCPKCQPET